MSEFTDQEKFLVKYYDDAVKTQVEYGVPLQITLAQFAVESAWGKNVQGKIFKEVNAPDSIRKKKLQNNLNKITVTGNINEAQYESFKEHALNLKRKFPLAFQYRHRPDEFIRSVQRDHEQRYSEEPVYAQKIISVMALINLLIKELRLNNQYKILRRRK